MPIVPGDSMTPAGPVIRVLLVDDSALLREGIAAVLRVHGGDSIQIVGSAGTVRDAVLLSRELRPDVVILDLRLPDGDGFTACSEIVSVNPTIGVLVLTSSVDDEFLYQSISAGAKGYLIKEIDPAGLLDAVRRVAAGQSVISPEQISRTLSVIRERSQQAATNFTLLSSQEKRVLELIVHGQTNKEIGDKLALRIP